MANVHYIWAGPYREKAGLEEIGDHAVQLCAMDVYLWCLAPDRTGIASKIKSRDNLHIVGLQPTLMGLDPDDIHRLERLLGNDVRLIAAVINHFVHNQAFSAIKDLLMLVVLYAMGGIYVDTTTQPAPPDLLSTPRGKPPLRGRRYQLGLFDPAPSSSIPVFPRIGTTTLFDRATPTRKAPDLVELYRDIERARHTEGIGALTPDVDAWACYATLSGNEYLGIMLKDYLFSCWSSGYVNAADSILGDSKARRGPVGDMIINAVQVGLLAAQRRSYAHREHAEMSKAELKTFSERHTWQAIVMEKDEKGDFYVPEIGMVKYHGRSWYET